LFSEYSNYLFLLLLCVLLTDLSDSLPDSALFLLPPPPPPSPDAHETPLASLSLSDCPAPDDIFLDDRLKEQTF
jgi:hypothetical protein